MRSAGLADTDVTAWFGVPVTTVARTVGDLARTDPPAGLMAADAALRHGLVTTAELDRVLVGMAGWPGVRRARVVAGLASPLAESPLESLTRWVVHVAASRSRNCRSRAPTPSAAARIASTCCPATVG